LNDRDSPIYQTLLELLGYELENNQANIGVSIVSDKESMTQKFGEAVEVKKRFYSNHALGDFLRDIIAYP